MPRKKEPWKKWEKWDKKHKCSCNHTGGGCVYFLGFLGALIYFLQTSTGFWATILAILKSLVWPVFVVMKILGL
jgi:hypothetical protein